MHEHLKSFRKKPTQKFVEKNLSILKNLKFFKKFLKLGQKNEMHEKNRENKIIPDEEMILRLKKLRKEVWSD